MPDLRGYVVVDARGQTIGPVASYWTDSASDRVLFAGVKTGFALPSLRLVPLAHARLDESRRVLQVPYERAAVLDAPAHAPHEPLSREKADEASAHYRLAPEGAAFTSGREPGDIALHEEKVHVDKRVVESGGVRLRKVVRRETIQVPVEVLREEVVLERVEAGQPPPADARGIPEEPFREGSLFLPTYREEPLVSKTTEVVGGVRASKRVETFQETVRAETRREDVEVERGTPSGGGAAFDRTPER